MSDNFSTFFKFNTIILKVIGLICDVQLIYMVAFRQMWMIFWALLITQQWYQGWWFDEGFNRLIVSTVFLRMMVRQCVPLSAVATAVQDSKYMWMKKTSAW